ncbi:MAG: endonuclease [Bacteroidales bacterium]|nr:endonuclease [Bacteroidales bacterium]MCF8386474.1 endonuclease [Bacteroidales bacterium]MCF8399410.1 endonuclease [Bacteroidales bacterium]
MKKITITILAFILSVLLYAQETGYYNGTAGKEGDALKSALNDIISGHTPYSYFFAKQIFKQSDADPDNPNNVILVYTGRSQDNEDYGNGGDQINREHVWAKSHGSFTDVPPMYGDVHNLKPCDASVNQDKSNFDFAEGGTQHPEATGCYYTDETWEPRDEVKGDIARIIFYMATRYEGENGELDLEVVDEINTFPNPTHGKLSDLLTWNLQDPPDDFERNRNNVIYSYQQNRNPFVDNPDFAELIWGGAQPNPIAMEDFEVNPATLHAGEPVEISVSITSSQASIEEAAIYWGNDYDNLENEIFMQSNGDEFTVEIPAQPEDTYVYYNIEATDGNNQKTSVTYRYYVPKSFNGTITRIYDIQGQQDVSPYEGEVVSTTGIVTGNFGTNYFIQDGAGEWNGLFIYDAGRNPSIGDSIVITGEIDEYFDKTEMKEIQDYYFISGNHQLPTPVTITTGDAGEALESTLVRVEDATCTDANYQANYFMWAVNDGSGELLIHNTSVFEYEPVEGESYNITGPLNYDFDEWKIELRFESDVTSGDDNTPPEVIEVEPILSTNIKVLFSEDVETSTAEDVSNYSISNDVVIESASQHAFIKSQVNLTVSEMQNGDFEISVENVEDMAGNIMEPQNIQFTWASIHEMIGPEGVNVFPNPTCEHLNISFYARKGGRVKLELLNTNALVVISKLADISQGGNQIVFDLNGLPSGLYYLKVSGRDASLKMKVVKQ